LPSKDGENSETIKIENLLVLKAETEAGETLQELRRPLLSFAHLS